MGRFDSNTLFMGILTVAFTVFSVTLLADGIYHTEVEEFGYPIEVADAAPAGGAAEEDEGIDPVLPLLASADVSAGEGVFRKCSSCHTNDPSGANKTGPGLWNVVGRPIAEHPGFGYSSSLTEYAAEAPAWTYEELNGFLRKPKSWVPGTSMGFAGLSDVQDRADVIAYLRTLGDTEAPLPTEEEIAAVTAAPADAVEGEAAAEGTETVQTTEDGVAPDEVATDDGVEGNLTADEPSEVPAEVTATDAAGEAATDVRVGGDTGQAGSDGAPVATDSVTGQGMAGNAIAGDAPAIDGAQAGFGMGNEPIGGVVVDETDGELEGNDVVPDAAIGAAQRAAPATGEDDTTIFAPDVPEGANEAPAADDFVVVPVEPITPAQ